MPHEERDLARMWDMLDASRRITEFTAGLTWEDYCRDERTRLAIERLIHIVGEAARAVLKQGQAMYSEIPWPKIIAQRNVIIHQYGEIIQEKFWDVATTKIPRLISQLEAIPPTPPQQ